jgi:hypothetical protein
VWALSGTPFERPADDLDGFLDMLRMGSEHNWDQNVSPCYYAQDREYKKIIKETDFMIKTGGNGKF